VVGDACLVDHAQHLIARVDAVLQIRKERRVLLVTR
jgi:hypothetical protein